MLGMNYRQGDGPENGIPAASDFSRRRSASAEGVPLIEAVERHGLSSANFDLGDPTARLRKPVESLGCGTGHQRRFSAHLPQHFVLNAGTA